MPDPAGDDLARDRRALPARTLALWSALIAGALVLVGLVAYRQLIYYERVAIHHVPAGASFALRVDLEQVVLFEPVRRHLLPLVDRAELAEAGAQPPPSRLVRLREQARLNLGLELREVVFARGRGGGWVLALGGLFGDEPLLPRLERVLRSEPGVHWRRDAGMLILEPSRLALGQADDGVLLLASDAALLMEALRPSAAHEAVGLSRRGAAALGALPGGLGARASVPRGDGALATPAWLGLSAWLKLGDPLELEARIELANPVEVDAMRRELARWLGTPSEGSGFAPQADWGGERSLAARATFTQPAPTEIRVHTTWERAEFEQATRSLAAWLEPHLRALGPAAP